MNTYINNIRACWKIYKDGRWNNPISFQRYVVWYTWNFAVIKVKKYFTN